MPVLTIFNFFQSQNLSISNYKIEEEGKAYEACQFNIDHHKVVYRKAKLTPKKKGLFVTFWKRTETGPIAPFHESDHFNFYIIKVNLAHTQGVFIFPKSELLKHHIVSSDQKEGKRGFRVYLPWETDLNKQATKSHAWQSKYYFDLKNETDQDAILQFFNN